MSNVVVLTSPPGLKVELQGFTAHLIKLNGERVPLCTANATCASFQVHDHPLLLSLNTGLARV